MLACAAPSAHVNCTLQAFRLHQRLCSELLHPNAKRPGHPQSLSMEPLLGDLCQHAGASNEDTYEYDEGLGEYVITQAEVRLFPP